MPDKMTQAEVLDLMKTERARWDELLAQISEEQMTRPGVSGDWSVKDIIAHVTWGEREILEVFRTHKLVGSELWDLPQAERNAAIFEQYRHQPLHQVIAESRQVYQDLLQIVETLSDEDLNDPSRYEDMPSEWEPWQLISQNTYEHYPDHIRDIEAWLDKSAVRA